MTYLETVLRAIEQTSEVDRIYLDGDTVRIEYGGPPEVGRYGGRSDPQVDYRDVSWNALERVVETVRGCGREVVSIRPGKPGDVVHGSRVVAVERSWIVELAHPTYD